MLTEGERLVAAVVAALEGPFHAVEYALTRHLAELFGDRYVLATQDGDFHVFDYAAAELCTIQTWDGMVSQNSYHYLDGPKRVREIGGWSLCWPTADGEQSLDLVMVQWRAGYCDKTVCFLAAGSRDEAERFFDAVCRWNRVLDETILVFDLGQWHKSQSLYREIRQTKLEDLVLPGCEREEVAGDLQRFIDRRAEFTKFGVPWKRGLLLSGPPGNGKTMCIKALANTLRTPDENGEPKPIDCLYVRSLESEHMPDHYTIGSVFGRARQSTPCLLIFEDLDSLVTEKNRSVFLNELDGLALNDGLIVLASTNHPDRLDPALRDRPSRFDRSWHFDLPAKRERQRYLVSWNARLESEVRLDEVGCEGIAGVTEGFSYAYLKELMVSSLMRWISERDSDPSAKLLDLVERQVGLLRDQMSRGEVDGDLS